MYKLLDALLDGYEDPSARSDQALVHQVAGKRAAAAIPLAVRQRFVVERPPRFASQTSPTLQLTRAGYDHWRNLRDYRKRNPSKKKLKPPEGWKTAELRRRGLDPKGNGWSIVQRVWNDMSDSQKLATYKAMRQTPSRKANPLRVHKAKARPVVMIRAASRSTTGLGIRTLTQHGGMLRRSSADRAEATFGTAFAARRAALAAEAQGYAVSARQASRNLLIENPKKRKANPRKRAYQAQAFRFDVDTWTPTRIKKWLKKNRHKAGKVRHIAHQGVYEVEQYDEDEYRPSSIHEIQIAKHVRAVVGIPRSASTEAGEAKGYNKRYSQETFRFKTPRKRVSGKRVSRADLDAWEYTEDLF